MKINEDKLYVILETEEGYNAEQIAKLKTALCLVKKSSKKKNPWILWLKKQPTTEKVYEIKATTKDLSIDTIIMHEHPELKWRAK
jgi:hypothetical protein